MKSRMTIGRMLTLSFGVVLVLTLAVGISSLSSIGRLGDSLDSAVNTTGRKSDGLSALRSGIQEISAQTRFAHVAYVVSHLERKTGDAAESANQCSSCHSPEIAEATRESITDGLTMLREQLAGLFGLFSDEADQENLIQIRDGLEQWMPTYEAYLAAAGEEFTSAHEVLREQLNPLVLGIDQAAGALANRQGESLRVASAEANSTVSRSRWIAFVLIGLNVLVLGGLAWVIRRSTSTLRKLVGEMEAEAQHVAGAARQVSASSQAMAQGASEQVASLEQTSASSEEINSTAQGNVENSKTASMITSKVSEGVIEANRRLEEMVEAMREINGSSEKISKIIQVIDDIAFQTNILALNAAVEAARAGEAGMGFAVVADEVRSLSQRCTQAARDTAALIEESISKSQGGKETLEKVAEAIRSITEDNKKVGELAGQVEDGSLNQARGTEQILAAITQMQRITQESAANAEESASVGQELDSQSAVLRRIVDELSNMVGRSQDAPPPPTGQRVKEDEPSMMTDA